MHGNVCVLCCHSFANNIVNAHTNIENQFEMVILMWSIKCITLYMNKSISLRKFLNSITVCKVAHESRNKSSFVKLIAADQLTTYMKSTLFSDNQACEKETALTSLAKQRQVITQNEAFYHVIFVHSQHIHLFSAHVYLISGHRCVVTAKPLAL